MAKHKARFWEHSAAYMPWVLTKARTDFMEAVVQARLTGDWTEATALRVRGRVGTPVRHWSEATRKPQKRWW